MYVLSLCLVYYSCISSYSIRLHSETLGCDRQTPQLVDFRKRFFFKIKAEKRSSVEKVLEQIRQPRNGVSKCTPSDVIKCEMEV